MQIEDLEHRFRWHPTNACAEEKRTVYTDVREQCLELALFINEKASDGRKLSLAITKLEEVMFWANAAIARNKEEGDGVR